MSDITTHPAYTCPAGIINAAYALGLINADEQVHVHFEYVHDMLHLDDECASNETVEAWRTVADLVEATATTSATGSGSDAQSRLLERWCPDCDEEANVSLSASLDDMKIAERLSMWKYSCSHAEYPADPGSTVTTLVPNVLLPGLLYHLDETVNNTSAAVPVARELFMHELARLTTEPIYVLAKQRFVLAMWASVANGGASLGDDVVSDPKLVRMPDLVPTRADEILAACHTGTDADITALYADVSGPLVWCYEAEWNVRLAVENPTLEGVDARMLQVPAAAIWNELRQHATRGSSMPTSLAHVPGPGETPEDIYVAAGLAHNVSQISDYVRGLVAART